jgi:hypothetical protein
VKQVHIESVFSSRHLGVVGMMDKDPPASHVTEGQELLEVTLHHAKSVSTNYTPLINVEEARKNPEEKVTKCSIGGSIKSFFYVPPSARPDLLYLILCGFFFVNTCTVRTRLFTRTNTRERTRTNHTNAHARTTRTHALHTRTHTRRTLRTTPHATPHHTLLTAIH